jgi:hypothetical protein
MIFPSAGASLMGIELAGDFARSLDNVHVSFLNRFLSYQPYYDPKTDPSQFRAALWEVRHLCTRAELVRSTVPGSYLFVQAIMAAIDDSAENETGH